MTLRPVMFAAAFAAAVCCSPAAGTPPSLDTNLSQLLPAPSSLEEWRVVEGPIEYLPGTLWEYLDGGAERYVSYGFRSLIHVRYQLGDDPFACVTLDLFDMGSDLGAFGIYRSGLTPGVARRDWGTEGHQSGTVAAAWKGSVYVHAEADDDRSGLIEVLERSIAHVCHAASGDDSPPAILDALPPEGLVPQSERYEAADLLGHAFLPGGVLATYAIDGREAEIFYSDLGNDKTAREALAKLRAHYALSGAVVADVQSIGSDGFRFSDPTLGSGIIVRAGCFVAVVHGDLPYVYQTRLLSRLAGQLNPPQAE